MIRYYIPILVLSGCANGVQQMSPEQLKAMEGLATCSYYQGMYGKAGLVTVNPDNLRKGSIGSSDVTIAPDCAVTIKGTSSAAELKAVTPK